LKKAPFNGFQGSALTFSAFYGASRRGDRKSFAFLSLSEKNKGNPLKTAFIFPETVYKR